MQGVRRLWDHAYAKHLGFVREVLHRHGVAARDVDDEANETFIAFGRALVRYGARYDEHRGRGVLHVLAVYRAGNYRTSARRRREVLAGDFFVDGPDLPSDTSSPETLVWITEALTRIDPGMSPIVCLLLEGFSIREIGNALRIPMGTASSRIRKFQLDAKRTLSRKVA
jgi:DNA-directed RNA polymerase specialized sigma24 family protein